MGFEKIASLITRKNLKEKEIEDIVNKTSLIDINNILEKLKRYRFQKYKNTKIIVDRLRKKRGY
jgi:hypothetical protein